MKHLHQSLNVEQHVIIIETLTALIIMGKTQSYYAV